MDRAAQRVRYYLRHATVFAFHANWDSTNYVNARYTLLTLQAAEYHLADLI